MIVRRPLHAPEQDGAVLAVPPLERVARLLATNRRQLRTGPTILGRDWEELRSLARRETIAAVRAYFAQAGEPTPALRHDSLLLSGHQPELIHPGVWVKHFALHGLAAAQGATPVNLIVDYDTVKNDVLRLPVFRDDDPATTQLLKISFDRWTGEVPYEERTVNDAALFSGLWQRVEELTRNWGFTPLLHDFWPLVVAQLDRTPLLGECLAAARRACERRWGCHNGEVPVSALCRTEAFAHFAGHVLINLPRFHATYNASVHDYRRAYGIRSRHHPVPDLGRTGDWYEAPFWAWRAGQGRRGRLLARVTSAGIELRADVETWPTLPAPPHAFRAAWPTLEAQGLKIRPRALTNTLFARLFLADLFIHGIGGGKYDELTDELIRRFYQLEPPSYLVLSATLRLPLPAAPATADQRYELVRRLRSLRFNPHRHLSEAVARQADVRVLLTRREDWLHRQPPTRRGRRERFTALRDLAEHLHRHVASEEKAVQQELQRTTQQLDANAVLRRRDYAACLYPEALLRGFCMRLLHPV